ncbi:MAG: sugar phosphate isomerase/epimerase [Clostridia bacterium]|nr:sugar phosphate isomerase/epimerase [Clostridia bacterium]
MKIQIGACTALPNAPIMNELGGKHIESGFAMYANMSEEQFVKEREILRATPVTVVSMNSMLPGDSVLYGTEEQSQKVCDFVRRGMERAASLGCKSVCMGSGTARNIPEGMTRDEAADRLASLIARFCAIADEYGIKVAIEPLRAEETNFIHTVEDAYDIIRRVPACKNLGVNPDMYHMHAGGEDFSNLVKYKDYVFNVHIAEPGTRVYPKPGSAENEALYVEFLSALKEAGYTGNVSVEAHTKDFKGDATVALSYLNELAAKI